MSEVRTRGQYRKQNLIEQYGADSRCPICGRKLHNANIADSCTMPVARLREFKSTAADPVENRTAKVSPPPRAIMGRFNNRFARDGGGGPDDTSARERHIQCQSRARSQSTSRSEYPACASTSLWDLSSSGRAQTKSPRRRCAVG